MEGGVEGVGLGGAERHHRGEVTEGVAVRLGAEADRHRERGLGGQPVWAWPASLLPRCAVTVPALPWTTAWSIPSFT